MKNFTKIIGLGLGVVFLTACSGGACSEYGDQLCVEDAGFTIGMDKDSVVDVSSFATPDGDVDLYVYSEEGEDGGWVASYGEFPVPVAEDDVELVLGSFATGAMGSLGIEDLEIDELVELNGVAGIHQRGVTSDGAVFVEYYAYLNHPTFYQLMYINGGEAPSEEELQSTVGSFEIL